MKNLKTLLVVVALTFSSALFAITTSEDLKTESATITEQVQKLLSNPNFLVENEIVANVKITLNDNNEMVVLSVDTKNKYVADYIKSRLNYSELPTALKSLDKTFIVPVRITVK